MILLLVALVVIGFVAVGLLGSLMWFLLSTVLVGLVMGGLGRLIVPGRQRMGLFATVLLGWCGAIVGTLIANWVGLGHLATLGLEVGASAVLVAGYSGRHRRGITGRRSLRAHF
ncbi:MAG: GlsB/YeaQ/YmgE family stress response membrane protein [Mycobacteriales bacterium]